MRKNPANVNASSVLWVAAAFLAAALVNLTAQAQNSEIPQPKVCEEVVKNSLKKSGGDFSRDLQKNYPSCAVWLEKACLSSFRLDQETPLTNLLLKSTTVEGQACVDCLKANIDPLGKSASSITSLMGRLKGAADPNLPKSYQAEFLRITLAHWHLVNEKRDADLSTILSYFDKEKLPKSVRNAQVRASIDTLVERVHAASERAGDQEKISYQEFVADQIAEAGEDVPVKWVDEEGTLQSDFYYGFYSKLKEQNSDSGRFAELVRRAKQVDTGDEEDFDGNLTPYHSKMILLYHLENSLRDKYKSDPSKADAILNEVASKLYLKADYSTKGNSSEWNWIIPHDGFVLGAGQSQINNLLKANEDPSKPPGTGVDCATFVHKMLLATGFANLKKVGRMTSAGIATGGQIKSVADITRMTHEEILKLGPGDLIVKRPKNDPVGHVEIVVGYEGDPPQIVTVSAAGGYQRTVVKRRHDIFPNQPKSCGSDNYFAESESNHYRAKLKRGP